MTEGYPINLLPSIQYQISTQKYSAYIPWMTNDNNIHRIGDMVYLISNYLGLKTDGSEYNPSYTYYYHTYNIFEIGIEGRELSKIMDSIKNIQEKLREHCCEFNEKLDLIIIERYSNE